MNTLTNKELTEINGGGFNWYAIAALGALGAFFAGVVDGIMNPQPCNRKRR
jgi:lactobin A/cerein 7B family class IIb bacteriocin